MTMLKTILTPLIFTISLMLTACGGGGVSYDNTVATTSAATTSVSTTAHVVTFSSAAHAILPTAMPVAGSAVTSTSMTKLASSSVTQSANATDINVLVVYPPSVTAAVSDVNGLITLAVAETNQAYQNSGVNIRMNLVNSAEIDYTEEGQAFGTLLEDLPYLAEVGSLREAAAADVVVMLTTKNDYCGLAYILPPSAYATAVVNYRCATGYYSFAHEIGHIQGAQHNVEDAGYAPFAYAHGHRNTATSPPWRTIMSYPCPTTNCPRLPYFSNSDINYNGLAMGTPSTNNNARVLNETAARIADFRNQL